MNIIVGPWDLDNWNTGEKFDIHEFIEKAEAGEFDKSFAKYGMDRNYPWYIQLKKDVKDGLYDKNGPNEKERYEKVLNDTIALDKYFNNGESSIEDIKKRLGSNMWIDAAYFISGKKIPYFIHKNYINVIMMTFRDKPEEGWRI